ncbi:MAG: COX15/CtaA family protein [Fidelibacterota bacterium]
MSRHKQIPYWLLTACILVFIMVLIGGITRLTHSGLSIVDWKPIHGVIPPLSDAEWQEEFAHYQQYPEYRLLNRHMTVTEFKDIFFWEYLHRLIGRLIGLVFIIPYCFFKYRKLIPHGMDRNLIIMFLLGAGQGFMGWYMVISGLVDKPFVSHYRLAAHLLLAFIIIGYIYWTYLTYYSRRETVAISRLLRSAIFLLPVVTLVQILYGAFTAGLKAGFSWNTYPLMNGAIIPEGLWLQDPWWLNLLQSEMTIQFIHRSLAIVLVILVVIIYQGLRRETRTRPQSLARQAILAIVLLQFTLGIITLLTAVQLAVALLHQLGAVLLFCSSLYLLFQFRE